MRTKLTVAEVADRMGVAVPTVYRWIADNGLPATRLSPVSNQFRIDPDELEAWIDTPDSADVEVGA